MSYHLKSVSEVLNWLQTHPQAMFVGTVDPSDDVLLFEVKAYITS